MKKTAVILVSSAIILGGCSLFGSNQITPGTYGNPTTSPGENQGATIPPGQNGQTPKETKIALTVTSPKNGSTVSNATLSVSGKTVPGAEVSVNDNILKADSQGNFSSTIILDEGENIISVVANDQYGNFAEQELTVTYNAPAQ